MPININNKKSVQEIYNEMMGLLILTGLCPQPTMHAAGRFIMRAASS